jgi:hypothetical protein
MRMDQSPWSIGAEGRMFRIDNLFLWGRAAVELVSRLAMRWRWDRQDLR